MRYAFVNCRIPRTNRYLNATCAPGPFLGPHPVGAGMIYTRATECSRASCALARLKRDATQRQGFLAAWGGRSFKVRRGCRVPA